MDSKRMSHELNRVSMADRDIRIRTVLISTSDKTGLADFASNLLKIIPDATVLSTGGTFDFLEKNLDPSLRKNVMQVSEYTGQPEMQGGLVKTLDFKIYLGLLSETYNEHHSADMKRTGAVPIDMVVVNLYPFQDTVETEACTVEDARTHIDIGGPCMLRAAAKNFLRVASVCSPAEYPSLIRELESTHGRVSFRTRYRLAMKTFEYTSRYDAAISGYLKNVDIDSAESVYSFMEK